MAENIEFLKPTGADTVLELLNAHNANMDAIANAPFPFEYGADTARSWQSGAEIVWSGLQYIKFASGTVIMWGNIDMGQTYVCGPGVWSVGWISHYFNISFPVPLVNVKPTVISSCDTDINADVFVMTNGITPDAFRGRFYAPFDESASGNGVNKKTVHVIVIGRWKE